MRIKMNYRVFNFDDSSTWPELNCPLLVFWTNDDWPLILQWDKEGRCFVDNHRSYYPTQCFYSYIGYAPYIEKECHPIKCGFNDWECPSYDDGYCLCGEKCNDQKEVTEYALGHKRIWEEFE